MKRACLLLLVLAAGGVLGQQVRRDAMSRVTIRGNIGIQKPLTSAQFQKSFAGLYEANLAGCLRMGTHFSIGAGYQSTYFKNNEFLRYELSPKASLPYRTSLLGDGVFGRLGYDRFFRTNAYMAYAINAGYMFCRYTNVNADTGRANQPLVGITFGSSYIQPEVSANFVMERRLAFSFFLSYTTLFYRYDPKAPRLNQFKEIYERGGKFPISYFNFGFGFTVLLGK